MARNWLRTSYVTVYSWLLSLLGDIQMVGVKLKIWEILCESNFFKLIGGKGVIGPEKEQVQITQTTFA